MCDYVSEVISAFGLPDTLCTGVISFTHVICPSVSPSFIRSPKVPHGHECKSWDSSLCGRLKTSVIFSLPGTNTWCVQVLRSPKEAFAAAMQSLRERCEKCVCLQGDYVEKWMHFQLPVVSSFFLNKLGDLITWTPHVFSSAPCSGTPSAYILPSVWQTKFHIYKTNRHN